MVTTDSLNGKTPEAYADDLYDNNGYGFGTDCDGVLLLVSTEDWDWHLSTCGYGMTAITDDGIALEWARIPHFFYNYYVFQYATGFSAAVAIANRILKEGESAVKDYKRFLSGGCSTDPISLLKIAGVDMSTPQPVNEALSLFGELIDEMEELMK